MLFSIARIFLWKVCIVGEEEKGIQFWTTKNAFRAIFVMENSALVKYIKRIKSKFYVETKNKKNDTWKIEIKTAKRRNSEVLLS